LIERDQAGAQPIVDVVIVVGDFVGNICDLGFYRRLLAIQKMRRASARFHASSV